MAARPKITRCGQDLPQHHGLSCLYAQLSLGPRAQVQPSCGQGWQRWSRGPPPVAAQQKENNNSNRHGNRAEYLLYTSKAEATASVLLRRKLILPRSENRFRGKSLQSMHKARVPMPAPQHQKNKQNKPKQQRKTAREQEKRGMNPGLPQTPFSLH